MLGTDIAFGIGIHNRGEFLQKLLPQSGQIQFRQGLHGHIRHKVGGGKFQLAALIVQHHQDTGLVIDPQNQRRLFLIKLDQNLPGDHAGHHFPLKDRQVGLAGICLLCNIQVGNRNQSCIHIGLNQLLRQLQYLPGRPGGHGLRHLQGIGAVADNGNGLLEGCLGSPKMKFYGIHGGIIRFVAILMDPGHQPRHQRSQDQNQSRQQQKKIVVPIDPVHTTLPHPR